MAVTKLADVIVPEIFNDYTVQKTVEKTELITSGVMQDLSAELKPQMAGTTVNMPFFNDLSGADEVMDDRYNLTAAGISTGQDIAVKLGRAKGFGSTDLAADLAGDDPMGVIADRFADYWSRRIQAAALSVLAGAMATTNSGGSMAGLTLDISALSGAAAYFDSDSFIDACGKLGDQDESLKGILVHSDTKRVMQKQDLIDFIKPSASGEPVPYYQGRRVFVDDTMPKLSGGIYHTYIFGPGALGFAQADPKVPVETERLAATGAGTDVLWHRRWFVVHPRGVKWVGTPARATPSNTELATASNWTRVYEAKNLRIVRFIHKLG